MRFLGLSRRPVASGGGNTTPRYPSSTAGFLHPDVDPPPRPSRPPVRALAVGLVVLFACLQLLPATHVRHPADPRRTWIPVSTGRSSPPEPSTAAAGEEEEEGIHLYSWVSCLDLRQLAVLVNSTLSNSRYPEHIHFNFIIPENENKKVYYYKLKVILPDSDISFIGQEVVMKNLRNFEEAKAISWPLHHVVTPLLIPIINPRVNRAIFISPDTIIKGSIEELFRMDLGPHAIAASEDCSKTFSDYVNIDVLNAIQRSSPKNCVSKQSYKGTACILDFDVLLLDMKKLWRYLLDATIWWNRVLNLQSERSEAIKVAITLALHDRHLKLSSWRLHKLPPSNADDVANILRFDGPRRNCSQQKISHQTYASSSIWQQFLLPKSDAILSH